MNLPMPFNNPRTYPGHSGVDYPQPRGTVFRASGEGVVTKHNTTELGGNQIWVRYDGGPKVGSAHMDSFDGCPPVGTRVHEGTPLGHVGSKGKRSTGPHLHQEIDGAATTAGYWRYFNPNQVISASGSGAGKEDADMLPDERNAVLSTHQATFYGGGDAGDQSLIARLVELQYGLREILPRVRNLDRQLTGADGQTINLVQHVLDAKAELGKIEHETDPEAIADAVAAAVPADLAQRVVDALSARLARRDV